MAPWLWQGGNSAKDGNPFRPGAKAMLDEPGSRGRPSSGCAPSGTWIRHLRKFVPDTDFLVLDAVLDGAPVAGTICIRHGNSATYQVGWNGSDGRRCHAHNLLLWQSALRLRDSGCTWLDLGGVNDQDAAGIARFKSGMGGAAVTLVGGYR